MEILFISYAREEAINFYRGHGIVANLEKMMPNDNFTLVQWSDMPTMSWNDFMHWKYDCVFFSRPFTKDVLTFLSYAKMFGKKIWCDMDDNLLDIAPENKYYTTYSREDVKDTIKSIVKLADAVSVTNQFLKEVYLPYNEKIFVIPNALNNDLFKRGTLKPRKKTMLWRGSDSHIYNLMMYGEKINTLIEEFPDWNFDFIGYYPFFLSPKKGFIEGTDIILYHQMLVNLAPSFVHAPISNDSFNRCRSFVSFLEGTFAGAACVVPDFWVSTGGWQLAGGIPYHDVNSYYEAMKACLSGEVDVAKQNTISWEFICDTLTLSRVNKLRVELLKTLE